jgi:hypothetical protein
MAYTPNSTVYYVQGLGPSITMDNFLSILPTAAKQGLSSHRVVKNGIAFLEYDGLQMLQKRKNETSFFLTCLHKKMKELK